MSPSIPQRLALAVEPRLLASMLERALRTERREVVVLESGCREQSGRFDVVVASGSVPSGVRGQATIRLPAPRASATTGVLRRNGSVEIVRLPTLQSLFRLIEEVLEGEA